MSSSQSVSRYYFPPRLRNAVTTILLLMTFVTPIFGLIGIVIMWACTSWKKPVKIVITVIVGLYALLVILASALLINHLYFNRPFQIAGQAMSPAYQNGQYVMSSIYHPDRQALLRGQIIVFQDPTDPNRDFIKRVIALPGDTVMIKDGSVYLNDQKLDESRYLASDIMTNPGAFLTESQPLTVPANNYFVLGDNRVGSSDSRIWGWVPAENIISIAGSCFWNCK